MTNPGDDAGQTPSSDSNDGASEPASGGYEAPPIEQSEGNPASSAQADATQQIQQPDATQQIQQPGYTPPPAYTPPPVYDAPSYPQQPGYPNFPPPDYSAPTDYPAPGAAQPGYPPPPYPGAPGYGVPSYPPPPQYGTPQYGAPPYGAPTPGYPPPMGYGPPPTGYPAPDYSIYGPPPQKTNTMAIASLIASFVGFVCWLGSIAGIVLGIVAMNQIKQSREQGRGLAIAGIAIGAVSLIVGFIFMVLAFNS